MSIVICEQLCQLRFVNNRRGLVILDPDMAKPWDEKIAHEDRTVGGKPIHVFYCQ